MAIGVAVKIITIHDVLVGIPEINIQGAPIGTFVCYLFISVVGVFFLCRHTKIVPNFMSILTAKPLLASLVCGVGAFVSYHLFSYFMSGKIAHESCSYSCYNSIYILSVYCLRLYRRKMFFRCQRGKKIARFLEEEGVF